MSGAVFLYLYCWYDNAIFYIKNIAIFIYFRQSLSFLPL